MSSSTTTSGSEAPLETPNILFERMVINDKKQNQRLSNGALNKRNDNANQGTKMRFVVCTLGLLSMIISQMSRSVLNISIPSMVDPSMLSKKGVSSDGSCPWPEDKERPDTTIAPDTTTEAIIQSWTSVQMDREDDAIQTKPISDIDDLSEPSTIQEDRGGESPMEDKFKWTMKQQTILLGGFYYSYFVFMVLGGRMAEMYGAKYVLMLSVAGSSLINLATPWMARNSFTLLVCSRIVTGAIQSGVFPGIYALFAKWLTMSETSIYAPLIKMGLRLGSFIGMLLPGLIPQWPIVFYFTGFMGILWSILWYFIATSSPADNKWVSEDELKHIMKKKRTFEPQQESINFELKDLDGKSIKVESKQANTKKTPWVKLITSPSVIGLIFAKLTFNYALDFIIILLPSYLSYVHHLSRQTLSAVTTTVFLVQVLLIVFVGWLAKVTVKKQPFGLSRTVIRKLFQGVSSYGISLSLFLLTFNNCNLVFVIVVLQLISFLSMFVAGGETMLPYDLSDEYPATIMAIANSISNISGITTTTLASIILGEEGGSYARWNILLYLIAGANLVGGLAFSILVKAEPIDFSSKKEEVNLEEGEQEKSNKSIVDKVEEVSTPPEQPVAAQPENLEETCKLPSAPLETDIVLQELDKQLDEPSPDSEELEKISLKSKQDGTHEDNKDEETSEIESEDKKC